MILSLALALTLTADSQGNVDISEQQLTQYVNSKVKYEQDYALPGLFDAHVKLSRMEVGLARSAARQADVQSFGNFTLTLPNKPSVDGTVQAKKYYAVDLQHKIWFGGSGEVKDTDL